MVNEVGQKVGERSLTLQSSDEIIQVGGSKHLSHILAIEGVRNCLWWFGSVQVYC